MLVADKGIFRLSLISLFRRIEKEIRRLRKDPAKTEAVDKLQKILLKQRSHPM